MQFFTTFDGLQLAYRDEGAGLPLLCLAGLTRNSTDFDYLAPHLDGVRLIRPDYRGRGASKWADDPASYTIPVETQDVLALLDHLGIDKAAVLGTSRGGLIAMSLAATARDRLLGVCLNDIGPVIERAGLDRIMEYLGRNPRFKTHREMAAAMPSGMIGFANVPMDRWQQEVENHTVETAQGLKINYDPALRLPMENAVDQPVPDLWPFFDTLEGLPTGLIRGAGSDLLSMQTVREMQKRRPDMRFAEIAVRGHVPFLDEPDAIDLIQRWLKDCQ